MALARILVPMFILSLAARGAAAQGCSLTPVSLSTTGIHGDGTHADISADGRFVAFSSGSSNLVVGVQGGIFLRDRATGTTTVVSVSSAGVPANGTAGDPSISADGRFVAFSSHDSNLVPGDTNGHSDVFIHDRSSGQTARASVAWDGSEPNMPCHGPSISPDGRFVTYSSQADNLVPLDQNNSQDVFLYDTLLATTTRVSVNSLEREGDSWSWAADVSAGGSLVAFQSSSTNLVQQDTNGAPDIFLRDVQDGITSLVSSDSSGVQGDSTSQIPVITPDGRFVAFNSYANNLVPGLNNLSGNVFVKDLSLGTTTLVSKNAAGAAANFLATSPSISDDGRYVTFSTDANNLVPFATNNRFNVYVHDLLTSSTALISLGPGSQPGNGSSTFSSVSGDGETIVFQTNAPNLVPAHPSGIVASACVFSPATYCTPVPNSLGCTPALAFDEGPSLSGPGFSITATNILNQKVGILLYSKTGPGSGAFAGQALCIAPPLRKTPLATSGGSFGLADCSGTYTFDFLAWMLSSQDPGLIAGQSVEAQFVSRDPGAPSTLSATDAVSFTITP